MEEKEPTREEKIYTDELEFLRRSTVMYKKVPAKKLAYIIFNRPDTLNAVTPGDEHAVRDMVIQAEQDEDVKVLIFKGEGSCFGTGAHLAQIGPDRGFGKLSTDRRPSQRTRLLSDKQRWHEGMHKVILQCAKPTIAQVHGYCYGAHFHTALFCDLVVAAENALFGHPAYRYIGPTAHIMILCMLTMGVRTTKEMMFTGRRIKAQEALECGLVNKVVPLDKLEAEALSLAEEVALLPFDALVMGKNFFEIAFDIMGVGTGITTGSALHALQTNIRYEPGEYNLFKARKDKGISQAIQEREKHYKTSPISQPDDKK